MYLSGHHAMEGIRSGARGVTRGAGSLLFTIAGAAVIGGGVPLLWVWVASMIAGDDRHITTALALFVAAGILVSYWVILLVAVWVRGRLMGADEVQAKVRRMSWNRSMRDEPLHPGESKTDPIERLFIATAIIGFIAFEIWFAFFAGSPLPG